MHLKAILEDGSFDFSVFWSDLVDESDWRKLRDWRESSLGDGFLRFEVFFWFSLSANLFEESSV